MFCNGHLSEIAIKLFSINAIFLYSNSTRSFRENDTLFYFVKRVFNKWEFSLLVFIFYASKRVLKINTKQICILISTTFIIFPSRSLFFEFFNNVQLRKSQRKVMQKVREINSGRGCSFRINFARDQLTRSSIHLVVIILF